MRTKSTRRPAVGTVKKSRATRSRTWLARNVRQVCDAGEPRFGSSRETVRSATSIPSLRSSPWILGAPHKGLVAAIVLMRAAVSARIGGRPASRPAGEPRPVLTEATALPPQDRVGRHDDQSPPPASPDSGQPHPQETIHRAQSGPRHRSFVHGELLAQGQVLEGELAVAAAEEGEESKQVEHEGDHQARILSGSELIDQPLAHRMEFWRRTGARRDRGPRGPVGAAARAHGTARGSPSGRRRGARRVDPGAPTTLRRGAPGGASAGTRGVSRRGRSPLTPARAAWTARGRVS